MFSGHANGTHSYQYAVFYHHIHKYLYAFANPYADSCIYPHSHQHVVSFSSNRAIRNYNGQYQSN